MAERGSVLTIEDESAVRSGIVAFLEDSGYRVHEADNGSRGLELFRSQRPDIVLCDLRIPGVDGLDVVSTVAAESPETPIIVVSGVARVSDAMQALKRGAWDFVTKPIQDMEVVESAIERALERARLMQQNRAYREGLEALNRELSRALQQFKVDHEAGRKTQFSLLPDDARRFGEYTFTRRLYPSMYLSGDFVDYFPIDERHVGFYMADVSGHGAASAFVTVMLKTLVSQYGEAWRARRDDTILHPGRTLERLDRDLRGQHLDQYLTMFYGVIDRSENRMSCSSGGQFPHPILYNGHATHLLPWRSRPIGLFDDSQFRERNVPLAPDSALLLVSDGVLELLPERSLHEKHETLRAQLRSSDVSLDEIASRFDLEAKKELPDDVTLLMVSRHHDRPAARH
jgi:serine phosphatase RsbU (regulator of sigma subunit)